MRWDNASVVQLMLKCKGGKGDVWAGGMLRTLGTLEVKGK